MQDCMITHNCMLVVSNYTSPHTNVTILQGQYYSPAAHELRHVPPDVIDNKCSLSPFVAVLFFISFELLCAFIIINIVVGKPTGVAC